MSDLAKFYAARLDEDEAAAKTAQLRFPGPWEQADSTDSPLPGAVTLYDATDESIGVIRGGYVAAHIARHDPARVLREIEADRALLDRLERAARYRDQVFAKEPPRSVSDEMRAVTTMLTLEAVVKFRAAVYGGHPDYDESWRP